MRGFTGPGKFCRSIDKEVDIQSRDLCLTSYRATSLTGWRTPPADWQKLLACGGMRCCNERCQLWEKWCIKSTYTEEGEHQIALQWVMAVNHFVKMVRPFLKWAKQILSNIWRHILMFDWWEHRFQVWHKKKICEICLVVNNLEVWDTIWTAFIWSTCLAL